MIELSPKEVFGGTVTIATAIILLFKKIGLLHIGTKESKGCPDPECFNEQKGLVLKQEAMGKDITAINKTLSEQIFPKLTKTGEDTAFIRGKIEGLRIVQVKDEP